MLNNASIKKHEKTPYAVKVTSNLSVKRLEKLIDDLAANNEMSKNPAAKTKDYAKCMAFKLKKEMRYII